MTKEEIIRDLHKYHHAFVDFIFNLNEEEFLKAKEGKWNAGQQLAHIKMSISPLNLALSLPQFVLKWKFGKANRPSKSYNELIEKYQSKLALGGVAPSKFSPPEVKFDEKLKLSNLVAKNVEAFGNRIKNLSENDLDILVIPHPLLGKLTLREMCYFTIYHVQHHQQLIGNGL